MMIRKSSDLGLTLIELLVVVSIISILSAIGISVFNTAQKNVRDQKRLRDLNTVKQALELYRSDLQRYPTSLVFGAAFTNPAGNKVYLSTLPNDFVSANAYVYQSMPSGCNNTTVICDSFVICAKKEGNNSFDLPPACSSISCGSGNCDLGLSSD